MKTFRQITAATIANTIVISIGLFGVVSVSAGAGMTDNQRLTQCRTSVTESIGDVDKIRVANIKSRPGSFEAKFRVVVNGERSIVLCKANREQLVAVSCLKGEACSASNVSAIAN